MRILIWATAVLLLPASLAAAQEAGKSPSAIVEVAEGTTPKLGLFDTLQEGQEIALAEGGTLTLGYFSSCIREEISGGTVTIGKQESDIAGGAVVRETVPCAGGEATLADSEAAESGALVLRAPPGAGEKGPLKIFSATPVFLVPITKRDVLVLRRLDRSAPEVAIPITARSVDLADAGPALRLGGHYEAQVGDRIVEFLVDPRARYRGGPLIGRLVPL